MKRIILTIALLGLAASAGAQMLFHRQMEIPTTTAADSVALADSLWWVEQPRTALTLGLSAGVTLFSPTHENEFSPYYSTHGIVLQVPLLISYQVSPHWRLSTGLRLDFNYNPLHYNVDLHSFTTTDGLTTVDGLEFGNYGNGKQHFYTHFGYIGIPLQATWYPWARERRLLGVSADLFAGYAFVNNLGLHISDASYAGTGVGIRENNNVIHNESSLLSWKLELGITLSTDVLGLLHGVRFFANFLPSYRNPISGDYLYLHGMTLFL